MLKKGLTIFTSIVVIIAMMTNIVLPVYALNGNISARPPVESGVYCIQSMAGDNKFVDVFGPSKESTTPIQICTKHEFLGSQYATPAFLNQEFYLYYDPSDGCYTIIPMFTVVDRNKQIIEDPPTCIGVENSSAGTKVVQRDLCFEDNFKWVIDKKEDGQVEFILKSTYQFSNKLKLEVGKNTAITVGVWPTGDLLQINNGNNSNAQKFKLSNWKPEKKGLNEKDTKDAIEAIKDMIDRTKGLSKDVPSGVYCIQSMAGDNKFLDINGPSYGDNGMLHIWTKHEYCSNWEYIRKSKFLNQEFYFWRHKDGYYTIIPMHTVFDGKNVNINSAKCIGLENFQGGAGTKVKQRNLRFDDNFKWKITKDKNGQYEFTLKSNGLKMDVADGKAVDGNFLHAWTANGTPAQRFKLHFWKPSKKDVDNKNARNARQKDIPKKLKEYLTKGLPALPKTVESGVYNIQSMVGNNMFLDIDGPSIAPDAKIQIYTKHELFGSRYASSKYLNQEFFIWRDPSDGYYTIMPMHTAVKDENPDDENPDKVKFLCSADSNGKVTQYSRFDNKPEDSFKWRIDCVENGQIEFTSKYNGLKLCVNGAPKNNTPVQLCSANGLSNQKFKLQLWDPRKKGIQCDSISESKINDESLSKEYLDKNSWVKLIRCVAKRLKEANDEEVNFDGYENITSEKTRFFKNMKKAIIPLSVKNIEENAFWGHDILSVICDPKWLSRFNRSKLKEIAVFPQKCVESEDCIASEKLFIDPDGKKEEKVHFLEGKPFVISIDPTEQNSKVKVFANFKVLSEVCQNGKPVELSLNGNKVSFGDIKPDGTTRKLVRFVNGVPYVLVIQPNVVLLNFVQQAGQVVTKPYSFTSKVTCFYNGKEIFQDNIPNGQPHPLTLFAPATLPIQRLRTYIKTENFKECANLEQLKIFFDDFKSKKELLLKLKIEDGALDNCAKLKSVNILTESKNDPTDIIDDPDFAYYFNLDRYIEVNVPEGIKKLRANRFKGKQCLRSVIVPDSVKEIEEGAFEGCENLKEIKLPEGIKEIPARAFKGCKNLSKLTIPKTVENIDKTAFEGCSSLCSDNVTCFETHKQTFDKLNKIVKVPSGSNLKKEEEEKFLELKNDFFNAETIEMPDYDKYDAKKYAELFNTNEEIKAKFIKCTPDVLKNLSNRAKFEGVFISNNTPSIDKASFEHCKDVKFIEIPESVKKVEDGTFKNCNNISVLKCPLRLLDKFNKTTIKHLVINEDIDKNSIEFKQFSGFENLQSIMVPDSWIEDRAIADKIAEKCPKLTIIRGVSGEKIFYNNKEENKFANGCNFKNVKVDPKWLDKVPKENKENIEKLVVPKDVLEVDETKFDGCNNLKELIFENENTKLCGKKCKSFEKINKIKCSAKTAATMNKDVKANLKNLELLDETKEIGNGELSGFHGLKNITLPESLEKIGSKGLSNCSNLEYIEIPKSVKNIASDAFENSRNIISISCELDLLKLLPISLKDQIQVIKLKDKNIDKVSENELKEFKNLEIVLNKDGKILYSKSENVNSEENKISGDAFEPTKENLNSETQGKPANVNQPNSVQPPAKLPNEQQKNLTSQDDKTTTVEDLVKADPNNEQYAKYIQQINDAVKLEKDPPSNMSDCSLQGITNTIIHVCSTIRKNDDNKNKRTPYTVQVLTILRLADQILNKKGALAQVKTGEGKSFIVAVLSIVLALKGRKPDIITSTIELAKENEKDQRKYYDLFEDEFVKLGLLDPKEKVSGVFYSKSSDSNRCDKDTKFDKTGYNSNVLKRLVIYSTVSNLEFADMNQLFSTPVRKERPYDVVIIDEVDNMLLDKANQPSILSRPMPILYQEQILSLMYTLQNVKDKNVRLEIFKKCFPGYKLGEDLIEKMTQAALLANNRYFNYKDYIVKYLPENGKREIIIMDQNTGAQQPGTRWQNYIAEMVEIKENLKAKETSVSYAATTHYVFFRKYARLAGLTGTMGTKEERETIRKTYAVNDIFEVPKNKPDKKIINEEIRPNNDTLLLLKAFNDVKKYKAKGNPVLVIFNYIYEANQFAKMLRANGVECNVVDGWDSNVDEKSINQAGKAGQVTVATIIAGRGTDIKVSEEGLKAGGLHVTVVSKMLNQRVLEQAIGRSARNGEWGSATIFVSSKRYYDRENTPLFDGAVGETNIPTFSPLYDNLNELQEKFSKYIREHWPWLYENTEEQIIQNAKYPMGAEVKDVFEIAGHLIDIDGANFAGQMKDMILTAWGLFFNRLSKDPGKYKNMGNCNAAYQGFLDELHQWVDPSGKYDVVCRDYLYKKVHKNDDVLAEIALGAGIVIAAGAVTLAWPETTVGAIVTSAIVGGAIGGITSIHAQLKNGGKINWAVVLPHVFGGMLTGAVLATPGLNTFQVAGGVAAIGSVEEYVSNLMDGNDPVDSIPLALISGGIQGVTAGGLKFVGDRFFGKVVGGKGQNKIIEEEINEIRFRPISDAEAEEIFGGLDYRKIFFEKCPDLKGKVVVHHSIEQNVLKKYSGLFTSEEINSVNMLRGIPKELNGTLHLSGIRKEWNKFYLAVDSGEIAMTKEAFLAKRDEIDKMFGHLFLPPIK